MGRYWSKDVMLKQFSYGNVVAIIFDYLGAMLPSKAAAMNGMHA
jgi:hypothetical protein